MQRDSREAVKYFRGAVEGGSEYGMWLLGRAYYEGRVEGGVDFVQAGRLFGLSGRMEAIKVRRGGDLRGLEYLSKGSNTTFVLRSS